jgi:hypothetical protein
MHQGLNKSKSKDQLHQIGNSTVFLESKSIQMLNKDGSRSKRLRDSSRDSYDSHHIIGRSSLGNIQPKTLFTTCASQSGNPQTNLFEDTTTKDDYSVSQFSNFGSQMNQLITSMKPQNSINFTTFRMSANALKYLFPIKEQKILFKRPGKDGQFANARVVIKLEDINLLSQAQSPGAIASEPQSTTSAQRTSLIKESTQAQPEAFSHAQSSATDKHADKQALPPQSPSNTAGLIIFAPEKQESTPRKGIKTQAAAQHNQNSAKTQHKVTKAEQETLQEFKATVIKYFLGGHYHEMLKNEDPQKSIELNDDDPAKVKDIEALLDGLEKHELSFKYCRLCECILTGPGAAQAPTPSLPEVAVEVEASQEAPSNQQPLPGPDSPADVQDQVPSKADLELLPNFESGTGLPVAASESQTGAPNEISSLH